MRTRAAFAVLVVGNVLSVVGWGCQGLLQGRTTTMRSSSMEPTIENGEVVRYRPIWEDEMVAVGRGEIVIFRPPMETKENEWLKRVVAVGGDVFEMREDRIFVNGKVVAAEYGKHPADRDPHDAEKYRSSPHPPVQEPVTVPIGTAPAY